MGYKDTTLALQLTSCPTHIDIGDGLIGSSGGYSQQSFGEESFTEIDLEERGLTGRKESELSVQHALCKLSLYLGGIHTLTSTFQSNNGVGSIDGYRPANNQFRQIGSLNANTGNLCSG
jgi:hypothetical protein